MKMIAYPMIVALIVGLCAPVFAQLAKDAAIRKAEAILKNFQRAVFDGEGKVAGLVFRPMALAVLPPE